MSGGLFEGLAQHFEHHPAQQQVHRAITTVAYRHLAEQRQQIPELAEHLGVWRHGPDVVVGLPDDHPHLPDLERIEYGDEEQHPRGSLARLQQRMPVELAGEIARAVRW